MDQKISEIFKCLEKHSLDSNRSSVSDETTDTPQDAKRLRRLKREPVESER